VESHGRNERAHDQSLEHDLIAKVVSTFADHALTLLATHWRCSELDAPSALPIVLSQSGFICFKAQTGLSVTANQYRNEEGTSRCPATPRPFGRYRFPHQRSGSGFGLGF
jgi:hypothetical protein